MACLRCRGLMVQYPIHGIVLWRCICCGERTDRTIEANRRFMLRGETIDERNNRIMASIRHWAGVLEW